MGLGLKLLPFTGKSFSHSVLRCEPFRELMDAIDELPERHVPDDFWSYVATLPNGETGYGLTTDTGYGPLGYVTVAALLPFAEHELVRTVDANRAVWAYLRELPPETKVALYWD